jgi:hypothetical protein
VFARFRGSEFYIYGVLFCSRAVWGQSYQIKSRDLFGTPICGPLSDNIKTEQEILSLTFNYFKIDLRSSNSSNSLRSTFIYPIPPIRILILILVLQNLLNLDVLNHLWYYLASDFHLKASFNLPSAVIFPVLPLNPQLCFILIFKHGT